MRHPPSEVAIQMSSAEPPDCSDCDGTGGVLCSLCHSPSQPSLLLNQLSLFSLFPVCQQWPCNCIWSPSQWAFWRFLYTWCQIWLGLLLTSSLWPPSSISSSPLLTALWHWILWQDFMPFLLLSIFFFFFFNCQSLGQHPYLKLSLQLSFQISWQKRKTQSETLRWYWFFNLSSREADIVRQAVCPVSIMIKLAKDNQFSTTSREKWMDRKLNWQQLREKDDKSWFWSQTPAFCWPAEGCPRPPPSLAIKKLGTGRSVQ